MKKLLKIEVSGSYEQCTRALFTGEKSTTAAKKKKVETQTQTQT